MPTETIRDILKWKKPNVSREPTRVMRHTLHRRNITSGGGRGEKKFCLMFYPD